MASLKAAAQGQPSASDPPPTRPRERQGRRGSAIGRTADSAWLKFVRGYLDKTFKLCRLNCADGGTQGFGPPIASNKLPLWSDACQLFWGYFSLKLLVNLALLHNYNVIKHQLEILGCERGQRSQLESPATAVQCRQKQAELGQALARIHLVGNHLAEMGFAGVVMLAFFFFLVQLSYVESRLYVAVRGPVTFGTLRLMLNPERERTHSTGGQISRLAGDFVSSSANLWMERREDLLDEWLERPSASVTRGPVMQLCPKHSFLALKQPQNAARLRALSRAHERTVCAISEMLTTGALVPANRQPEWALTMGRTFGALVALFEISSNALVLALVVGLPLSGLFNFEMHAGPRDLLFQAELIAYFQLGAKAVASNFIIIIVSAFDQAKLVTEIRLITAQLISEVSRVQRTGGPRNLWLAAASLGGARGQLAKTRDQLNRRLIRLLILYRLFHVQLRSVQPTVGFLSAHVSFVMLMVPLMGRLYITHLEQEMRLIILGCSIFVILSCDCLLLPACYLNARCLDMLRSMCSLLAYINHARSGWRPGQPGATFDEHTVDLLRRELHSPELVARSLAIDGFFLKLTYASFLGIHFWCGLLLAPLLFGDPAGAHSSKTGNLFTDPFRLF